MDARLLYGLVLSWEGRYDEARPVLQQVLTQAPAYTDARVALMNVEYWSGHSTEALEQADRILASQPGNVTARAVRDRIEAANRPWWAGTTLFARRVRRWNGALAGGLGLADAPDRRRLADRALEPRGTIRPAGQLLRGRSSTRGSGPGRTPSSALGVAPESAPSLYPQYRVAFDLYQSLGRRLRSVGRRALHGLLSDHADLRRHAHEVHRQLDVDRKGLLRPRRRRPPFEHLRRRVSPLLRRRRHQLRRPQLQSRLQPRRGPQHPGSGDVQLRYGRAESSTCSSARARASPAAPA